MAELRSLRLENINASENELFLHVLHDIRSPLTVLKVLLARLEHTPEGFSRELIAAVFERIESISETMLTSSAPAKLFSLPQALHAVLTEKTIQFDKRIQFQASICPIAASLNINSREMMRLFSNLINNAVQAGATFIRIEARHCADAIDISVTDDGLGFSETALADLKSGIDHLISRPGHGFGLRHARQLAASLGGQLWLRSLAGQGSCITLSVPYETAC